MELITTLRTFVRVSETRSFSAVASELGVAPSVVSRQLTSLEEHLGTRLIHRTTRAISLTEEGHNLLPLARQTLDAADTLLYSVHQTANAPNGRVRLGCPVALGPLLSRRLAILLDRYRDISIDLVPYEEAGDMIEAGRDIDVRIGPVADSTMISRNLGSMETVLVAAPYYLRGRPTLLAPDELPDHQCIVYRNNVWTFTSAESEHTVAVDGRVRTNNAEAVRHAAIHGLGIALLPRMLIEDDLREERLESILPDFQTPRMPLSIVYPSRRNLPARTRVVLEFLTDLRIIKLDQSSRVPSITTPQTVSPPH
jgi:DNA-binding transcriptional LysR family regulator